MKAATIVVEGKKVSLGDIPKILEEFINSVDEESDPCAGCTEKCCDIDAVIPQDVLPKAHTAHLKAFRKLYNEVLAHGYKVTIDADQNMKIYQTTDTLVDI